MHKIIYWIVLVFCCGQITWSQPIIDSLITELDNATSDTARVNILLNLTAQLYLYDPVRATDYGIQCLQLSENIGYRDKLADVYYNLAIVHQNKGNSEIALNFLTRCEKLFREEHDTGGLARTNNGFGKLWFNEDSFKQAQTYFEESNRLFTLINDSTNMGGTFENIGHALDKQGKHEEAYYYLSLAGDLIKQRGSYRKQASFYLNLGEHYEMTGEFDSVLDYYAKGLELSILANSKPRIADSYYCFGRYYYNTDQRELSIENFDSAYHYYVITENLEGIKDCSEHLMWLHRKSGNITLAWEYSDICDNVIDSLDRMRVNDQLAQIVWNRQLAMERQIQERQRLIIYFSLISLFLMIVLLAVLFRNYRMKQKSNHLLAEIDQLKSRMFSNISHEFRTPLTLIMGPLEEMLREESSKKPSVNTIKMMRRNADRLLSLVNQMMDLSKMDAGQLKLELTEGDVIRAVKVMILAFSSLAEKKNIQYEFDIPGGDCITFYDQDKLEKITNNLLSNAFKFTPEEGRVIVRIGLDSERKTKTLPPFTCQAPVLKLVVEDTGKGIPKDQLKKVFDRFHQVEGSFELENIGTGIGLALTQELVDLMHGNISVDSTLGSGSIFTVTIPLGKEHLSENEFTIAEKVAGMTEQRHMSEDEEDIPDEEIDTEPLVQDLPSILIVEDHADIRQHIRENMSYYNILEAENGKDGFEQAAENIPDLIITDLMMPEMDGVELCKSLKTDERTSHIPVIMLTAKASVEDRIEGLETGADDYITKPFNMKELKVRINNLIEQRRKLRERFTKELNLGPKDIAVTSADERFLNRIIEVIENNITDADLDVAGLSNQAAMSRMQLYRKIKALTDQTPSEFIRTIRLKRAAQLMRDKFGNIAEITYEAGFNHPSYFAKSFKELFGESPSDYIKNH